MIIYETPADWGSETVYGTRDAMEETIASLIDAGGPDWKSISIEECEEWEEIAVINGYHICCAPAIPHCRDLAEFIVLRDDVDGFFTRVGPVMWDEDDAREFVAGLH